MRHFEPHIDTLKAIAANPGLKGSELCLILGCEKKSLNRLLYGLKSNGIVEQDESNYTWSLSEETRQQLDLTTIQPHSTATNEDFSASTIEKEESPIHFEESTLVANSESSSLDNPTKKQQDTPMPPVETIPTAPFETTDQEKQDIRQAIEKFREDLLDLSRRNSLINVKLTGNKRFIHIIDEIPAQLCELLLSGAELTFESVPEATPEETEQWLKDNKQKEGSPSLNTVAQWHNIDLSHDLAKDSRGGVGERHDDSAIQTPYFPSDLEARLKIIKRESDLQIQETGMNTLYLTVGFLEWKDTTNSCVSPLFSIPISLIKGKLDPVSQTYIYTIRWSGEDLITNLSLAKRLERDFDFVLPSLGTNDDGNTQNVEDYLETVESAIKEAHPTWSILRRGTVSFLNFAKLLMVKDLDPDRWPELLNHELVKATILGSSGGSESSSGEFNFCDDHTIDNIDDIHDNFPLVDSADSSQHSAIIEALKGNNLVIEGPPGSGKSQTITNLIAAFLNKGKSVLFVSEKMAALSVVKDRLTNVGLGDFVLELHSHATKKLGVVESLSTRCRLPQKSIPRNYKNEVIKNGALTAKLNNYADLINQEWNSTELTIAEIFAAHNKERTTFERIFPDQDGYSISGIETPLARTDLYRKAKNFNSSVRELEQVCEANHLQNHPWYGIHNSQLTTLDAREACSALESWIIQLQPIEKHLLALSKSSTYNVSQPLYTDIDSLIEFNAQLPSLSGVHLPLFTWAYSASESRDQLSELCRSAKEIEIELEGLASPLTSSDLLKVPQLAHSELQQQVDTLEISSNNSLSELARLKATLHELEASLDIIKEILHEFEELCDNNTPAELTSDTATVASLQKFAEICQWVTRLKAAIPYRSQALLKGEILDQGEQVSTALKEFENRKSSISDRYSTSSLLSAEELDKCDRDTKDAGFFTKLFGKDYKAAISLIQDKYTKDKKSFKSTPISEHISHLKELTRTRGTYETFLQECPSDVQALYSPLDSATLSTTLSWHRQLLNDFGSQKGRLLAVIQLSELGQWLLDAPAPLLDILEKFDAAGLFDAVSKFSHALNNITELSEAVANNISQNSPVADIPHTSEYEACKGLTPMIETLEQHPLANAHDSLRANLDTISTVENLQNSTTQLLTEFMHINGQLHTAYEFPKNDPSPLFSTLLKTNEALSSQLFSTQSNATGHKFFAEHICSEPTFDKYNNFTNWLSDLSSQKSAESAAYEHLNSLLSLDKNEWTGAHHYSISDLLRRTQRALDNENLFAGYVLTLQAKSTLANIAPHEIVSAIQLGKIPGDDVRRVCRYGVMLAYIDQIFEMHPELASFQGGTHESYIRDFRKSHKSLDTLHRDVIKSRLLKIPVTQGRRGLRVSDYTEYQLIDHECGKQTRHIPIRQLLTRAGRAAQELKPCFMMGPRSVAQYLPPGKIEFDVLIIDEASQLKPEEAIGACARAKQMIVVGDSKQLPPTNFFNMTNGDDVDDAIAAADSESILDAARKANISQRILRWHYRSRHESLIAFSNTKFYNNELEIFPSPTRQSTDYGIEFFFIEDGLFENQKNRVEAWRVAERLRHLLLENPEQSIGIATMNKKQAEAIELYIEQMAKECHEFDAALASNRDTKEPLFIKNLETVQGDERDVIIISCTYGRGNAGAPPQRFGPINGDMGWRRLNVLFTRSRTRMELFSSMHYGDVKVGESSSRGVHALRDFLHYAETGHLSVPERTGRTADSDFEVAVAELLSLHGYECDFQIGVAGYFIDLAVRHPSAPDRFIMGIECDGATYHSAKSARDRDILRQDILESLGWNIKRIWSTDWFNHPQQALQPIIDELRQLEKSSIVSKSQTKWQIDSDSRSPEPADEPFNQQDDTEAIEPTEEVTAADIVTIEVRDRVVIEYLDSGEVHTFEISYSHSGLSSNKIHHESPLARTLMNAPVEIMGKPITVIDREVRVRNVEKAVSLN